MREARHRSIKRERVSRKQIESRTAKSVCTARQLEATAVLRSRLQPRSTGTRAQLLLLLLFVNKRVSRGAGHVTASRPHWSVGAAAPVAAPAPVYHRQSDRPDVALRADYAPRRDRELFFLLFIFRVLCCELARSRH